MTSPYDAAYLAGVEDGAEIGELAIHRAGIEIAKARMSVLVAGMLVGLLAYLLVMKGADQWVSRTGFSLLSQSR